MEKSNSDDVKYVPETIVEITPIKKTSFSATLYITNTYTDIEKILIIDAAMEWNRKSKGIINFSIELEPFKIIDLSKGILLLSVNKYDPDIVYLDVATGMFGNAIGITSDNGIVPYIKTVSERINTGVMFRGTILHELGHYIGLSHNDTEDGKNTLMYYAVQGGSTDITHYDLMKMCEIYECDNSKIVEIESATEVQPLRTIW